MELNIFFLLTSSTFVFLSNEAAKSNIKVKGILGNNGGDIPEILKKFADLKNPIELSFDQTLELEIENKKICLYHGKDKRLLEDLILSKNIMLFLQVIPIKLEMKI